MNVPLSEDRGKHHYVWIWSDDEWQWPCDSNYVFCTFSPAPNGSLQIISVPIGWHLEPDPLQGVVLRSTFGTTLTAHGAFKLATEGKDGFKIKQR